MTTTTRALDRPAGRRFSWLPDGRLLRAEFLKLRRRRGLMIAAAVMTVGAVLAYFAVAQGLHLSSPHRYGPAGGGHNLAHAVYILVDLGAVAAIVLGASLGAADLTAGVFRNLVSTGRSRTALFLARLPAGLVLSVAFTLAAYALAAACSALLAGSQPTAPAHLMLAAGGWLAVSTCVVFLLALGLSSVTGSQSITIAVLLALTIVVTPLVASASALPDIRQALPGIAVYELQPAALGHLGVQGLTMTTTSIAVVLTAWTAVAVGAGLWRTATRDA